jgi:hypothetical protein
MDGFVVRDQCDDVGALECCDVEPEERFMEAFSSYELIVNEFHHCSLLEEFKVGLLA